MRKLGGIIGLVLVIFVSRARAQMRFDFVMEPGRDKTTIPFELLSNLMVIEVTLNDQLPVKFVFDSGVRTPILTDKYLSDIIRVSYNREVEIFSAGAQGKAIAYVASGVAISVPGVRAENQDIYVLKEDFLGLSEVLGEKVHGLIGYDFFKNFVVEVDYDDQEITLTRPEAFKPKAFATRVPLSVVDSKAYITADAVLPKQGAKQISLLIDTGASHALWLDPPADSTQDALPDRVLETAVGRALSGEIRGVIGRVPQLTIDKFEFSSVLTSFPYRSRFLEVVKGTGRDGSIGAEVLRRFRVTFDYQNGALYLERASDYRDPFHYNMAGLSLIRDLKTAIPSYVVERVDKDSPAEAAGIQPGDRVLRFNGVQQEDLSLDHVNYILKAREGKRIRLTIERDGNIIKKEFRLKSLI